MVCTRSKATAQAGMPPVVEAPAEDRSIGSVWWFREILGLNGYGAIPGTDLGADECSRAEYVEFWGRKNYNNGCRYKRKVSPKMVRRIRHLYQLCFQRPVGCSEAIPYHFGRGLLAERNGHPINWAAYARKMTHRGTGDIAHLGRGVQQQGQLTRNGVPFSFVTMEELRLKTSAEDWPKNEVGAESGDEEGSASDWNLNVQFVPDPENAGKYKRVNSPAAPNTHGNASPVAGAPLSVPNIVNEGTVP